MKVSFLFVSSQEAHLIERMKSFSENNFAYFLYVSIRLNGQSKIWITTDNTNYVYLLNGIGPVGDDVLEYRCFVIESIAGCRWKLLSALEYTRNGYESYHMT